MDEWPRMKSPDDLIDLCGMARHAAAFYDAALLLRTPAGKPMESDSLGVSALVNAAFAVEIGLKATIACEKRIATYPELRAYLKKELGRYNLHNIELLFQHLAPDTQWRIRLYFELHQPAKWDTLISGTSFMDFSRMIFAKAELDSFEKLLTHASDSFEKWRYKFESGASVGSLTFLLTLAESVLESLPRPFHNDYVPP